MAKRHATKTDGVWRVMRFEDSAGRYAEVASNEVGPEAIPVPKGYRFVSSTPMVPCDDAAIERVARVLCSQRGYSWDDAGDGLQMALTAAAGQALHAAGEADR